MPKPDIERPVCGRIARQLDADIGRQRHGVLGRQDVGQLAGGDWNGFSVSVLIEDVEAIGIARASPRSLNTAAGLGEAGRSEDADNGETFALAGIDVADIDPVGDGFAIRDGGIDIHGQPLQGCGAIAGMVDQSGLSDDNKNPECLYRENPAVNRAGWIVERVVVAGGIPSLPGRPAVVGCIFRRRIRQFTAHRHCATPHGWVLTCPSGRL